MISFRVAAALALIAATEPALAASLDLAGQPTSGVAGRAYFRLPIGATHAETPRVGLSMAVTRQDRDAGGMAFGPRREADAVDFRVSLTGERTLALAGTPVAGAEALAATEDGKKRSPWVTAAFVVGGLAVAGGLYFAYLLHEAEKHSD